MRFFVPLLIIFTVASVIYIVPIIIPVLTEIRPLFAIVVVIVGTLAEATRHVWQYLQNENQKQTSQDNTEREIRSRDRVLYRALRNQLITLSSYVAPPDLQCRAFIFYFDEKDELLKYFASSRNNVTSQETRLAFGRLEGVVGDVFWRAKKMTAYDIDEISGDNPAFAEERIRQMFKFHPDTHRVHVEATKNFCSIVAVPIPSPKDQTKIIGVLTVDSPLPLSESKLGLPPLSEEIYVATRAASEILHFLI